MGITSWLKSFTILETTLTILITLFTAALIASMFLFLETYDNAEMFLPTKPLGREKNVSAVLKNTTDNTINTTMTSFINITMTTAPNFFFINTPNQPLQTVTVDFPQQVLIDFNMIQNTYEKMSPGTMLVMGKEYNYIVALMESGNLAKNKCSAVALNKFWALSTASCSKTFEKKNINKFKLMEFGDDSSGIMDSYEHKLDKVINHPKYIDGDSQNDLSLLKIKDPFNLSKNCFVRLLTPWASAMVKAADILVVITWRSSRVLTSHDNKKKLMITYATPMFLKEDDTLFDWRDTNSTNKQILDTNVFNIGSPVLKGLALYAFISHNGNMTKLANHHKWIYDEMNTYNSLDF